MGFSLGASPLWQIVHHGWNTFLADYEQHHRKSLGPLRTGTIATVESFLRCGDLAAGFTRYQCPDCGHEKLLAFTRKRRHFCPACHQRRVRSASGWIATCVCHDVPHRQFVFTIPRVLRGIFRKRRKLLTRLRHPPPPFDIETMEPVEPPWQAIKEWIPDDEPNLTWFNQERKPLGDDSRQYDQRVHRSLGEGVSLAWRPTKIPLGDGLTLVLDPT